MSRTVLRFRKNTYTFRQWTNRKTAVLASFHKEIRIAVLTLACTTLIAAPVLAQRDSADHLTSYELEELEIPGSAGTDMGSPEIQQLFVIGTGQIQESSAPSLSDLLNQYPSIDIRTRGVGGIQSDFSIAGGSFDQALILLNGIPVNNPQTGHFNLDIPLYYGFLKRIEMLKGASAKTYGVNAYAGALNLVTEPGDSLSAGIKAGYGMFGTTTLHSVFHLPLKKARNMLSTSLSSSQGYRENTDFQSGNLFYHLEHEGKYLNSCFFTGYSRKNFGANAFYSPRFPEQYEETESFFAAAGFNSVQISGISGDIYFRQYNDHFLLVRSNPSFYENYHRTRTAGVALNYTKQGKLGQTKFNLTLRHEGILSTSLGNTRENAVPIRSSNNKDYTKSASRTYPSFSINHTWRSGILSVESGMLISAGIRDQINPGIYPGIDLALRISDHVTLFSSINRSMRLPTYTDLYYSGPQNLGNTELQPEKALNGQAGMNVNRGILRLQAAIYYRKGNGTIDWIWQDSLWHTMNFTILHSYGGEISATLLARNPKSKIFISSVDWRYSYNEILKPEDNVISHYVLDNLRHKAALVLNLEVFHRGFLRFSTTYFDRDGSYLYYPAPDASPVDKEYEPYILADISTGYRNSGTELYISVYNLFNTTYSELGNITMPGRWLHAGIKYHWK